ncbi:MAG: LPS-assembly protein LptD [Alphaproteobacteria bacterium]|nr:LPS-assembly protein LptD [Alphaproteobacteria bacterium]
MTVPGQRRRRVGSGGALLLGLMLAGPSGAAAPVGAVDEEPSSVEGDALHVEASHVALEDGLVTGEGDVRATWGADRATAQRFTLDPDTGRLELWEGTWRRPGGEVAFARAEIELQTGEGTLYRAEVLAAGGKVRGEALTWTEDGVLVGEALEVTTCTGCTRPTWEVRARHAEIVPGEVVRFRGGTVRLCGLPVLPVPWGRVTLAERRSGFLVPRVGGGEDGWLVAVPAWLALGPRAELELTPELRTARGARLQAGGSWQHLDGDGEARLVAGWDTVEDRTRGSGRVRQGLASGPWTLAVDAALEGDRAYLADYGDAFLSRSMPWSETRLVAALGPVRVEHDGVQALASSLDPDAGALAVHHQRPVSLVASAPGRRLGPAATDGGARLDVFGAGTDPWRLDAEGTPAGHLQAWLGGAVGQDLLPALRGELDADARVRTWTDGAPWGEAEVAARLLVPGWLGDGTARLLSEVGLQTTVTGVAGDADLRLPWERAAPAWAVGPVATTRLLTATGVPVRATGSLQLTETGLLPRGTLRADRGAWRLRADADPSLQDLRLGYDDGVLAAETGVAHLSPGGTGDPLLQARSSLDLALPAPLSGWRPGYSAFLDVQGGRLLAHGPRLAWSSPCQCLDLGLTATWSADRDLPDVAFAAQLR